MNNPNTSTFNQLYRGKAKEAWSDSNLKPLYAGYIPPHSKFGTRVNDKLYELIVKARNTIGPAEIQHKQFLRMVEFRAEQNGETVISE